MAPPGFGPPGSTVPPRYRHRQPPPDGTDTNTRPYFVLFGYLASCISIAVFIVLRAARRFLVARKSFLAQPPPKKSLCLFSALAICSLVSAWTYMLRYIEISYKTWLMWRSYYELEPHQTHWGLWLKETSLFREFWEIVILGNARYWWTHQVFFFALALGLYLEQKGLHRGVRYTWAFMLLGQLVSVSLATNLFFLTALSSPSVPRWKPALDQRGNWMGLWLLNLIAILVTTYSAMELAYEHYWHHSTASMPVLLAPRIALLLLSAARALLPASILVRDIQASKNTYKYMHVLAAANASLMLVWTTNTAYSYGGFQGIQHALHEHPAVSCVAYDVIFCWISWLCWIQCDDSRTKRRTRDMELDTADRPASTGTDSAFRHDQYNNELRSR